MSATTDQIDKEREAWISRGFAVPLNKAPEKSRTNSNRIVNITEQREAWIERRFAGQAYSSVPIQNIADTYPDDVQQNAANQTALLTKYYDEVLKQAQTGFKWAVVASLIGLAFFLGAIIIFLSFNSIDGAVISMVGGAIVEVIAGLNFYLYGKTTAQFSEFHQRLAQTQRFLLANSICSLIEDAGRQTSRAELVQVIATDMRKESLTPSTEKK
jgi:hypothetical protein